MARTDPLTGLPNRRAFGEAATLELERARRSGRPLSFAYLDCDGFKHVNDSLGHREGDALLVVVAQTLRASTRAVDALARLGGDEFGLLMHETDAAAALALLTRVRTNLLAAMERHGWHVGFSIGVATFVEAPGRYDDLLARGDELMYEAKRTARGTIRAETFGSRPAGAALAAAREAGALRCSFFATCSKGTEGALRQELAALKLPAVRGGRGGVHFEGRLEHGAKACLHSRTAMRVLLELAAFPVDDADALYEGARGVDWTPWLTERTTLAVEATGLAPGVTHTGFAALKVKDGVVDMLRDKLGARPDVDTRNPDVPIVLHLDGGQATLSLDLAGEPLHKRGWRTTTSVAPLKETLAAAVLLLGRVDVDAPFVDPLCGSGTLAIEQALRARRIAPGLDRAFAFQRWPCYRDELQSRWDKLRAQARAAVLPPAPAPIFASDFHPKAIDACRRNAHLAGVTGDVVIEQANVRDLQPRGERGHPLHEPALRRAAHRRGGGARGPLGGADPGAQAGRLLPDPRRAAGAPPRAGAPCSSRATRSCRRPWGARPEIDHRLWNGPLEIHLLRYRL